MIILKNKNIEDFAKRLESSNENNYFNIGIDEERVLISINKEIAKSHFKSLISKSTEYNSTTKTFTFPIFYKHNVKTKKIGDVGVEVSSKNQSDTLLNEHFETAEMFISLPDNIDSIIQKCNKVKKKKETAPKKVRYTRDELQEMFDDGCFPSGYDDTPFR